ncbi:MAG: alpha/beta fold hydrolase [Dehalococcoidia bacterium]|nr:alpha/beta fold hydrolase [Dehalococcoidia bacterium]
MPYARVNGARLYFEQHGSGPDLVFLHGAGGNHLSWWQQLPFFAPTYRCTVYDARGWGLSQGEMAVGRWALGTDLVALLDELGIERAHIVAQSMGGRAVAGLARLAPGRSRSLVLCGTTAGATNDRVRALQDELRLERGDGGLREFALAPRFEAANPALSLLYRQINALNPRRPRGFLGKPPPGYRGRMHEQLAALGVPVLFVVGEHDRITSPAMIREAHTLVAGSSYYEVRGAGHSAYFEAAEEWNAVVEAFLAGLEENPQRRPT